MFAAETVYPRQREPPKGYLETIVADSERQVENKRVEQVVASGSVEQDLRNALEVGSFIIVHLEGVSFLFSNERSQICLCLYHCMTVHLTLSSCRTGKIRLSTNQKKTYLIKI